MPARSSTFTTLICALLVRACLGRDSSPPAAKKAKHRDRPFSYVEKGQYQEALIEYQNVTQQIPMMAMPTIGLPWSI